MEYYEQNVFPIESKVEAKLVLERWNSVICGCVTLMPLFHQS